MARYQAGQDPRKQRKNKDQLKASIRLTSTGPGKYRAQLRNDGDPTFYVNGKPRPKHDPHHGPYTARPTDSWTGRKEYDLNNGLGEFGRHVRTRNAEEEKKKQNRKFQ
jgi:hypothetical protein